MTNIKRWTKIMNYYYAGLNSNFLKSDLKDAGFIISSAEQPNTLNTTSGQIKIGFREIAVSNETGDKKHEIS